ncbi:taste receptor type 2 member 7-like [Lissotriton helveticus]
MLSPADIALLVLFMITFVTGLLGNSCILAKNAADWMKSTNLNSCDLIISSLAASNVCLQCAFFSSYLCSTINLDFFLTQALQYFLAMKCIFDSLSVWTSAWLCVHYCVKIVTCNRALFLQLKMNFPRMVPWLILYSVLISLVISLPRLWDFRRASKANTTLAVSGNGATSKPITDSSSAFLFVTYVSVFVLAFGIMVLSAFMIIISLSRHMKKMAESADGFRRPRQDAHLSALKTVTSLLILCVLFYLCQSFLILRVVKRGENAYIVCTCFVSIFPSLNSVILIMGSSRLKKGLVEALLHAKSCFRMAPDTAAIH